MRRLRRPAGGGLLQAGCYQRALLGNFGKQGLYDVQQQVLAGGLPGREERTSEKRITGIDGATLALMQYQRMIVDVDNKALHDLLQVREVDDHAILGVAMRLRWLTFQGDIQHVAVPVDVGTKTIVAAQGMGHFEGKTLGDADLPGHVHRCKVRLWAWIKVHRPLDPTQRAVSEGDGPLQDKGN